MKYKGIEKLEGEKFRRLTGVKKATFERMVEILEVEDKRKKKLEVEEKVNFA